MKEEVFIELGFEKIIVPPEQSGSPNDWYYYSLDIGNLSLLTSASDEIVDGNWYCYFVESDDFKMDNEADLRDLVRILRIAFKIDVR
jgi:hypothetical protein